MKTLKSLVIGMSLVWGFSAFAADAEVEQASKSLGAESVTEVTFEEGRTEVPEMAKSEIRELIQEARSKGGIDDVKIAVWADREYPHADTKASKEDVALATKRGDNLRDFIKKEMDISSVSTYNMTERPNALQKFLKTPEAKVKETLEARGAAPKTETETGLFGQGSKSSKAVIMIYN